MRIAESARVAAAPPPARRRRFTVGVFLFVFLIAAIITITFTLIAAQARSGYFVGFEGDTVVVFKGQRDKVLWFAPTVAVRSERTRTELSPQVIDAVEARPTFGTADEAAAFVLNEVVPTTAAPETTTTTTVPPTVPPTGETTTTAVQGP